MNLGRNIRSLALGLTLATGLALMANSGQPLHAQQTSGALTGTATDTTGAGIPGAAVAVVNKATGVKVDGVANARGEFNVPNLPAGTYDITVSAKGFTSSTLNDFQVDLNKTSDVVVKLPAAGAQTLVEVSSEAEVSIDTSSAQLQTSFSLKEVTDLPTATVGLGVLNLSLLSANVETSGGVGAGTGPSVGGQRPRANNFTIEGIDNNDKSVTGPLVYVPNDAVGEFTLITNQFSPEFGHSAGGQFNTIVVSGTNAFHGRAYEYFDNRNLNAIDATVARTFAGTGVAPKNPRYDFNRYGGQLGGPILKNKLFFFGNYERQTTGQNTAYALCTPTAAGLAVIGSAPNLSATNVAILTKYLPASPSQIDAANDAACGDEQSGGQYTTLSSLGLGNGTITNVPLGNYQVSAPSFSNYDALTTSADYTLSEKDSVRGRYIYNTEGTEDTSASLPVFFTTEPFRYHLIALSEYHVFSPTITNELRVGFNRYYSDTPSGNFSFPGLDSFPNLVYNDLGGINVGPDGNAPQSTIQNLYQLTDNVSWTKGAHTFTFGFDGRKYISPQSFTQRVRGDYEYNGIDDYLHDISPTYFGERSTGDFFYYGDQTAFYGYGNDTWRVTPTLTINAGLRYEFTAVPVGERVQAINSAASEPGLISFSEPKPQYLNFAPRFGVNWAPNAETSIRAGFGMAYDVLYDNLGILSFPPQYSSTEDVDTSNPTPGFLAGGGLPKGTGTLQTFGSIADQRAATSGYVPNQKLPYAETWSLGVQHVFAKDYTAEVRYLGTRGIHLSTQNRINVQPRVDAQDFLPTYLANSPTQGGLDGLTETLGTIKARPRILPEYSAAGFVNNIVAFEPYSESNYNGASATLVRRFNHGLQLDFAYTYSKTMDNATADVFSTVLSPRRPQNPRDLASEYSRSALDHTHRLTLEAVYDLPFFKNSSNYLLKNGLGNWEVAPIYTYQSPEYTTAQSAVDANLDGDSAGDRTIINPTGVKGTGSAVTALTNSAGKTVGYQAIDPTAYYIQAGPGALATAGRNTLPIRPTDDLDATALKRVNITERYSFEFQAQAFNTLNHPQFISGYLNTVGSFGDTGSTSFVRVNNALFGKPDKVFPSNARSLQLALKFLF